MKRLLLFVAAVASSVSMSYSQCANDPTVTTPINACTGVGSIPLTAEAYAAPLTYTINLYDSWGDGWNGAQVEILEDGIVIYTAGTGFTNGSTWTETFPVNEGTTLTTNWISGTFDGECTFDILDENSTIIGSGDGAGPTPITPYIVPTYTLSWYDAPGGNLLGTGSPFEAVGTSVMPTASAGTYDFWVESDNGTCPSNPVQVTVNVSAVNVELAIVDETCAGTMDGTFGISSVTCGTAPFTFSVDGGPFGPAPTNLSAGTYTVVVQDVNTELSAPMSVTIGLMSSVTPADPVAASPIDACSGSPSIMLTADPVGTMTYTYTIDLFDSFGDGWNGAQVEILADGVVIHTAGAAFTNGSTWTETFTVTEGTTLTTNWISGVFDGECTFDILDDNLTVVASGDGAGPTPITPYMVPMGSYTINWYDAPGGTLLGTGSPFEAVGTSVMPTAATGSYDFYVTSYNGCESNAVLVTVNVADVLVEITPQDETCTGYANGTFAISNVFCGTAPFQFSVDGGPFGAAPTNLTAGTYSVVVEDANTNQSSVVSVTIGTAETVIPDAPIVVDTAVYACTGDPSILIDAVTLVGDSLLTTMAAGNGFNGNMFSITATNNVNVTQFAINANAGTGDYEVWYRPDDYLLTPGSNTSNVGWTQLGSATGVVSANPNYTVIPITFSVAIPAGQTYSFHVIQTAGPGVAYTNGTAVGSAFASDANITFNEGHGGDYFNCTNVPRVFNGMIYYEAGGGVVEWFDTPDPLTGTLQGTGAPFETVGTGVLPDPNINGVYPFYAASNNNGCYSLTSELVNVYVAPVNVDIDPIDADCNNAATGSFAISNVDCGTAPFTFSVDGGAFGPAPTDLLPGTYTIVVQDANTDLSGPIYVVVGEAAPPSGLTMVTITDNGGQVSWIANGSETEWYVEWGLPGFVPGTGAEIGSATATDTFHIITGLDGNTTYDVYVAANCGPTEVVGDWSLIQFTTACGIYMDLPFVETFEDNSETRVCWINFWEVGTADWTYQTGSSGGAINTAYEGTLNARFVSAPGTNDPISKLVSPRFDFTAQDSVALTFAYGQQNWAGDQNITNVYVRYSDTTPWYLIQSYTMDVAEWTVDTLFVIDSTGTMQIAFEGVNNWGYANVVDDVEFMPCSLTSGTNGAVDVCRADSVLNLNTVITPGEDFGYWSFPQNETFITNDSIASIGLLPEGTHYFYYIVKTPCAADTTVAAVTVYGPSQAGIDGTINACMNQPINLYSGLSGTVDLGGQWYDPQNNPTSSDITTAGIGGNFNYDYVTSNGVCPNDTSNIVVVVDQNCDWLNVEELMFSEVSLYPNPTSSSVAITNNNNDFSYDFEVTDVRGKTIEDKDGFVKANSVTTIDLEELESGMYLIRLYNEYGEKVFRVIKE